LDRKPIKAGEKMGVFPEIPGYRIVGELGRGGVAVVFLGIHDRLNRKVAIKVLEESTLRQDENIPRRFLREAETTARFSHSNIIQIFDTGKNDRFYYIVTEYLEESLRNRINREPEGKIPPEIAFEIVDDIMGALDYVHLQGIYHRDIKPSNIMFRKDNTPVLLDFGIAHVLDEHLTKTMATVGTTYYMSPEQCRGYDIDGRSDVYSLGVVLFEMLTGEKPYKGNTPGIITSQHLEKPVPRLPESLNPYQPLIDKMMAKDRDERISSRPEFKELLKKIKDNANKQIPPLKEPSTPLPEEQTSSPTKHNSPYIATAAADSSFKKVTSQLKSLSQKFWNFIYEKLESFFLFLGDMKDKLILSMREKFKTLNQLMNKPIMKKLLLVILPAVVIFAAALIIIFNQGNQNAANQSTPSGITFSLFGDIFKQAPEYYEKLTHIQELYHKDDLKSLNDAEGLINELKKTAIIPELDELERKISKRKDLLNKMFETYFEGAVKHFRGKDFPKAKEYISKAKQIKPYDKNILELEKLIVKTIEKKKSGKKEKLKSIENQ
jgi:serine/threonine protein kinase